MLAPKKIYNSILIYDEFEFGYAAQAFVQRKIIAVMISLPA
jgi:hypothetical protein